MKLSEAGLVFLKTHEGIVHKIYDDGAGYLTGGCGHCLDEAELKVYKLGDRVPEPQVDNWLRADVKEAEDCVNAQVTVSITQEAFDSLVSFVFNVGCGAFKKSTLLRYINKELWEDASEEFQKWNRAGGGIMAGLIKRRENERDLFLSGQLTKEVA